MPVSCTGKKTLGHDDVENDREHKRSSRDEQNRGLNCSAHRKRTSIESNDALKHVLRSLVEPALLIRGVCFSSREHIIGVSVRETTAETRIVTLSVTANSRNSCQRYPP